jgi:hypothetical protein
MVGEDELFQMELNLHPNEASGLEEIGDEELLGEHGWDLGFWACLEIEGVHLRLSRLLVAEAPELARLRRQSQRSGVFQYFIGVGLGGDFGVDLGDPTFRVEQEGDASGHAPVA